MGMLGLQLALGFYLLRDHFDASLGLMKEQKDKTTKASRKFTILLDCF